MYSLNYKVTTSTCDSEGRLKLYSALQMMQDCSEMWIDSEPDVKQYFKEQNMAQLLARCSQGVAPMMQESNNDFFSIDAILLFDCCPIDVRYNIEEQTGLKRV